VHIQLDIHMDWLTKYNHLDLMNKIQHLYNLDRTNFDHMYNSYRGPNTGHNLLHLDLLELALLAMALALEMELVLVLELEPLREDNMDTEMDMDMDMDLDKDKVDDLDSIRHRRDRLDLHKMEPFPMTDSLLLLSPE